MRALLLFLCLSSFSGIAQTPASTRPDNAKFAAEPLVFERLQSAWIMQADGTGVHEHTAVIRIQSESGLKSMAVLNQGFAANSEKVEWISIHLRHQDGSASETPVTAAVEVALPVTREAPFYSDLKESQLPVKDLRIGDTLEFKVRVTRTRAEAANQFWGEETFATEGVMLAEEVSLDVPAGQYVNVWSPKLKPVETSPGDRHLYRWTSSHLEPTVGPEADARKLAESKRVWSVGEEAERRLGKLPDIAWTTFKSWKDVGDWYRGLEGERILPDADIKARVAQLIAGKTTQAEKVQAVYAYVATQIHYIGVAFGVGRYQPHSAGDVLGNQYGDCKDKHTLLAAMLGVLGLEPDAVLIGVEIRLNPLVPAPSAFNHVITRVQVDGKPVWLDSTAEVAPYGMLLYATRDKQALVVPGKGLAGLERTPVNPPFASTVTMLAKGSLDAEGTSTSRITLTVRGDEEVLLRSVLRNASAAQYDQVAQQLCQAMGYAGTASHLEMSRVEDTSTPFEISFDYKRPLSGDWPTLRIVPQLAPVGLPVPDDKNPPVESLLLGPPRTESSTASMTLPEGWGAELPEAVHAKSEWVNYDLTFRLDKGVLYSERRVEILQQTVPQADWPTYARFAERASLGSEQFVQLLNKAENRSGKTAKLTIGVTGSGGSENPAQLVEEAYQALQRFEPATAEPILDKVKAINPEQARLWGCYGDLALQHGDMTGAIRDYKKELSLHPASIQVYPVLVRVQLAGKQVADATETLHRWAEAAPDNAQPAIMLTSLQLEDGSKSGAELAAATAAEALTRLQSDNLKLLLGRAQLLAGQTDKGRATLVALLQSTDDPGSMNDAAYELANASLELPLAEHMTHQALDRLEEQSRAWTLDENAATLAQKTRLMQATWDTMGWILFREGKAEQGEAWIRASWNGRRSAEVGEHLAQIELARGDRNAALTQLELALLCSPSPSVLKELTAQADTLRTSGARAANKNAGLALQKLRTLPLGPGLDGYAEYKLLLSPKGVERLTPAGEKTVPDALEKARRANVAGLFPPASNARLMLNMMVNCHQGQCELVALQ